MTDVSFIQGTSAYGLLASEYYDAERHPTCANFRWASDRLFDRLVPHPPGRTLCDVGAGDSALASWLCRHQYPVDGLLLIDESAEMLAHSKRWIDAGARHLLSDAHDLPLENGSVDLLVASLADPFDDSDWWLEVSRVLAANGTALVTTPAENWARPFRTAIDEPVGSARFLTRSGFHVDVPSYVRSRAAEHSLIESACLRVIAEDQVKRLHIPDPVSPKLDLLGPDEAVVVAYMVAH